MELSSWKTTVRELLLKILDLPRVELHSAQRVAVNVEASPWETIVRDLLLMILDRLPVTDYFRFPAVCLSWKGAMTDHRLDGNSSPRQLPWLILPEDKMSLDQRLFYSLSEQQYYRFPAPVDSQGKHCVGSSHGWLMFLDYECLYLLLVNPFSGLKIEIPLPPKLSPDIFFRHGSLSTSPSDPECLVLLWNRGGIYTFCRIGNKEWMTWFCPVHEDDVFWWQNDEYGFLLANPLIFEGKLHISFGPKDIIILHLPTDTYILDLPPNLFKMCFGIPDFKLLPEYKCWMEVDGEIWLICFMGGVFYVFKADLSGKVWTKLDNLGDRVLFLGRGCSLCLPAAATGCPGNRIFYSNSYGCIFQWSEYDYFSHQCVNRELGNIPGFMQSSFRRETLWWLEPSYPPWREGEGEGDKGSALSS